MARKKIAVIGAGISGLTCAYELQKAGFDVTVFEKSDYVGGRMASRSKEGLYFDIGANHLANVYRAARQYCKELGIEWQPVSSPHYRILKDGKLVRVRDAVNFIARAKLIARTLTKRSTADYFDLTQCASFDTDNAYSYFLDKFGEDAANYLIDGLASTYQFHSSLDLSKGVAVGFVDSLAHETKDWKLHNMSAGMSALPEAFADCLNVRLNASVTTVLPGVDDILLEVGEETLQFNAVVMAATAPATLDMLLVTTVAQMEVLANTRYSSTIGVAFRVDWHKLPNIAIVWMPKIVSQTISGYVNEAVKGVMHDGKTLMCTWLHDEFAAELKNRSDAEVYELVKKELARLCPWAEESDLENFDIQRWQEAMPIFSKGHLTRVAEFLEGGHQGVHGIYLCGDYMNSIWVEGSIRGGKRTADAVIQDLTS
ncbi:protoporphyrinogen/coproporphyrinogen oxidase [Patescibacteria group bacterium]